MAPLPVVVRMIDPPLHEFLPNHAELVGEVARLEAVGGDPQRLAEKRRLLDAVESLIEANPMLGLRGVRLGILHPEIIEMQVRALLEAACELAAGGVHVRPEIMIPLSSHHRELEFMDRIVRAAANQVFAERGGEHVDYKFGTMIEIPRAALTAAEIAVTSEFFSFGTNDLTQTTFGLSRDDATRFLHVYVERGILQADPFQTLDVSGVGQLVRMATERGRAARSDLEVGICGEHGGDPASIHFCHDIGLDYVSCSPLRIPVARIAAAHAALNERARFEE
jgi:pyruvate,orthophosphate dikinase